MFIPDLVFFPIPDPEIKKAPDPGSQIRIRNTAVIPSKLSEKLSGMFIPDPDFLPIPDPEIKKAPDPGSQIRIRNTAVIPLFRRMLELNPEQLKCSQS
jgi:hypothetical protein